MFKHIKRPAVVFCVGAVCAFIVCFYTESRLFDVIAAAAAVILMTAAVISDRPEFALPALLLFGLCFAFSADCLYQTAYINPVKDMTGKTFTTQAAVVNRPGNYSVKIIAEADGRIFTALLYGNLTEYGLEAGDKISFVGEYAAVDDTAYYSSKGIYLSVSPASGITGIKDTSVWLLPMKAFTAAREQCGLLFGSEGKYFYALILGDQSGLTLVDRNMLADIGILHAFVVSGMHLTFIAAMLAILKLRKSTSVLLLTACMFFSVLTGFGIPIIRAMIMITVSVFAKIIGREYDSPTALFVSLFIILTVNPRAVADVSLILSYSAVAGALFIYPPAKERVLRGLSMIKNSGIKKISEKVAEAGLLTLCASVATLPAAAFYIGRISLVFLLSNILLLWMTTAIFAAGTLALLISYIYFPAGEFAAFIAEAGMKIFIYGAGKMASVPYASVAAEGIYIKIAVLFITAAILTGLAKGIKTSILIPSVTAVLCTALIFTRIDAIGTDAEIIIYDNVIYTEARGRTVIINGDDDNYSAVENLMRENNIKKADIYIECGSSGEGSTENKYADITLSGEGEITFGDVAIKSDSIFGGVTKVEIMIGDTAVTYLVEPCYIENTNGIILADSSILGDDMLFKFTGQSDIIVTGGVLSADKSKLYSGELFYPDYSGRLTVKIKGSEIYID